LNPKDCDIRNEYYLKNGLKKRFNLSKNAKKDYGNSFKELYSRDPSDEELKAFIKMNKERTKK